MDIIDWTGEVVEDSDIPECTRTLRPHSQEIKEKFADFHTLSSWDEADVWMYPMDLTLLPLREMNLEELYQLHKSLSRIYASQEAVDSEPPEGLARQTYNSLVLVEQWIYFHEIITPQIEAGSTKWHDFPAGHLAGLERAKRVGGRIRLEKYGNREWSHRKHFGKFWGYFSKLS